MTEMHESTGTYALNALDAAELTEFEAHLATCETCSVEVAEFCETAVELSLLSLATPPSTLRSHVLDAIRIEPQLSAPDSAAGAGASGTPIATRPAALTARRPRRAVPGSEPPDEPELPRLPEPEPAPVDELAERRQRRRTRILSGLVAAMLVLAVGLGGRDLHPGATASGPDRVDDARAAAVRRARRASSSATTWPAADR